MKGSVVGGWALGLAIASSVPMLHPIHGADAFWHLSLARAVLAAGSRVVPEPNAFPAFSDPAVVPEWLWGLLTYGLYQVGGHAALTWLAVGVAALCALVLVRFLVASRPDAPLAALVPVSLLVMTLEVARLRARPQAAFLLILPVFLALSKSWLEADPPRRLRLGVGLLGLEVLWAQLHGSFVLGPALFALMALPRLLRHRRGRELARCGGVFGALSLCCLTSAYGLGIADYILIHGAGDAQLHMSDMHAPTWQSLSPFEGPFYPAYFALWVIGLAGAVEGRRVVWEHAALALLGLLLASNAVRFVAAAGLLLAPFALDGATILVRRLATGAALGWATAALAGWLFIAGGVVIRDSYGPIGQVGLSEGLHPEAAAVYLRRVPAGSRVFTQMTAGSPLAFALAGRARTFLDTRTPLYFDDTDFALAREAWEYPDALARTLAHYDVAAVVVDRERSTCRLVGEEWVPVVVEPRFTTFVKRGEGQALSAVAACGASYLGGDLCREGGAVLRGEIERLASLGDSPFLNYLRARERFHCARDAEAALALLPSRRQAWHYRKQRGLLEAQVHLARGELEAALGLLRGPVSQGDEDSLRLLIPSLARQELPAADSRELLESFVDVWVDRTPVDVRALLARSCLRLGDAECVRFHGMRAALRGDPSAGEILPWLARHHPSERVRLDAGRWHRELRGPVGPGASGLTPPSRESPAAAREP